MSQVIKVKAEVDVTGIEDKFESLCNDPSTMLEIHQLLVRMCDPYVPFLNGPLSQTVEISPEFVRYTQPYAHYQYKGVGFNHTLDYHPLASAEWDQAMMRDKREEFVQEVRNILVRRAKQL